MEIDRVMFCNGETIITFKIVPTYDFIVIAPAKKTLFEELGIEAW